MSRPSPFASVPKLLSPLSKLHEELLAIWPPIADLPFPVKRPMSRMLLGTVLEERIVALEAFLQGALSLLGVYAAIDPRYVCRVWWRPRLYIPSIHIERD